MIALERGRVRDKSKTINVGRSDSGVAVLEAGPYNVQFDPPYEKPAFTLGDGEYDLPKRYAQPLDVVVEALKTCKNYNDIVENFPDVG